MSVDREIFSRFPVKRRKKRESRRFTFLFYRALYGPFAFFRAVYRQLIVLAGMFIWGTVIFAYFEGLPALKALLASISTITTIGFYVPNGGNYFTMDPMEAVALIIMVLISVGAGASILQTSVNTIAKGELAKGQATKRILKKLKNHVIVFGYSHLGRYVAEKLEEIGMDYVVISRDPAVYNELLNKNCFCVLAYETQTMKALNEAGIDRASMVVVAHEKDADNVLSILSSRKLRPDVRIISVIHDKTLIDTAKNAGADMVIPSSVTVGHLLALSAVTKNLVGVVFSERIGTQEIAEFSIFKGSAMIGKGLAQVSECATILGLIREGQLVKNLFDPTLRLQEDDTLLLFGDPVCLLPLENEAKAR